MLKVDPTLDHVPARREHVIALFESINQPLVNIPRFGTAPTGAFILGTRNDAGNYTAFVYLYQPDTKAVVIYVSEPRALTTEQYRAEEAESVRFVESMGFMVDNVHFPTLAPPEQEAVMGRIPMFRPPGPTVDLYDEAAASSTGDPFAATDQQLDAIFGGLSASDGDVFRQAGLSPTPSHPPTSGLGSGFGSSLSSGLGSGLPPGFVSAPPDGRLHHGGAPLPQNTGLGSQVPLSSPSQHSAPPIMSSGPTSSPQSAPKPLDQAALERIGRLLGMFALLFVITAVFTACRTTRDDNDEEDSAVVTTKLDIANQHLVAGQFAESIRAYESVLEESPEHKDALRGTALAYMNLGHFDDAEQFYRRAIVADDAWSMPKNELAVVLLQTGRCAEAEAQLRKVLKDIFYPTPEYAEHNLARALACQGDVPGAVDRLEKLVLKRPHFCLGYLTLADLSAKSKLHETTISACDDFAHNCEQHAEIKKQVSPEQSDLCYLKKGLAYAELGDLESARSSFMRCQSKGQLGKECKESLEMLPP